MTTGEIGKSSRFFLFVFQNVVMVAIVVVVVYLSWVVTVHRGLSQTGSAAVVSSKVNTTRKVDDKNTFTATISTDRQTTAFPYTVAKNNRAETRNEERKRKRKRKRTRHGNQPSREQHFSLVDWTTKADVSSAHDDANVARKKTSGDKVMLKASYVNVIKPRRTDESQMEDSNWGVNETERSAVGGEQTTTAADSRDVSTTEVKPDAVVKTQWSPWGSCSLSCGVGQQERIRSCGPHCQEIESKPCLLQPCEGNDHTWLDKWAYFEMLDMTSEVDLDTEASSDPCERWMKCSNQSIQHYLTKIAQLPSCPCHYPISLAFDDRLYDDEQEAYFTWEDASGVGERNDVYRPGASFCIRSLLPRDSFSLAAQHCCYDSRQRLITRGRDAGTPNLVSPQISRELHKKVDLLPWVMCKGDWTRYDLVIHPNNKRQCAENPCMEEIQEQVRQAKLY